MKEIIRSEIRSPLLSLLLVAALTVVVLVLTLSITAGALPMAPGGYEFVNGDFSPVSVAEAQPDAWAVTGPSAPAFGALVYDPDFRTIEEAAREKLKRGLEARVALSPYKGNQDFETYVKQFNYKAGWDLDYTGSSPYEESLKLIDLIDRVDQDLRDARDLYAYLLVYAPEDRFRADPAYITDTPTGYGEPLCGATDKEDPDPADDQQRGHVLDPVIDWCNFRARLRQSVREAANLRMLFGQQFMVDAMGLHFSGTGFYGGEPAVREELAQLRAAKHQYELAEQGLSEALGRVVGSGCYVSDFYEQPEWSLLSRAMESQETAQHHIATRLSYLDIDIPEQVPQVHAEAQNAFRQASTEGYIRLIGIASLSNAQPVGVGCNVGERPDGLLAAQMAANLLETRRKSREMADGRNVFGFDVTFTPARPYKESDVTACAQISKGSGLWEWACGAAELAKDLQDDEIDNTRAFDNSQQQLLGEIDEIRQEIDARITAVSGCTETVKYEVLKECVQEQIDLLKTCAAEVASVDIAPTNPFDTCMGNPQILEEEAKQALYDLRSIFMRYLTIETQAENIAKRVAEANDANATVRGWLAASGAAETAARVAQAALNMVSCMTPVDPFKPNSWFVGTAINTACAVAGGTNIALQATAGALSTAADVAIEDAEHHKEVQNLLLDQSELVIEAYAANQQFASKSSQFLALLDGLSSDLVEAQRQRAYFEHSPANDPSFRIARDSSRMVLAKQMEYAARMAYLAARRAEYEYAARLSASNFRISDIYRSRTADDILGYLDTLAGFTAGLAGSPDYETDAMDLRISLARHELLYTDEWLKDEYRITDPGEAQAKRTELFREWVADHTVPNNFELPYDGKDVLRFSFSTSLLDGGLFSQVIQQGYDGFWLLKLSGIGQPKISSNGVSVNVVTEEAGMSYRTTRMTQGGMVHLRSKAGCTFDYRLIAPAVLLGLEWAEGQDPEVATAMFRANVNDAHDYAENAFRTRTFLGRSVSSTDWEVLVFSGAPQEGMPDMDLQQLTDIELIFSITYASRTPGAPELSECTRIDY